MYTEMTCGTCDSYFQVDSEQEDAVWMMMHRFANAHSECGFMAPNQGEAALNLTKKVIKPRLSDDSEEA